MIDARTKCVVWDLDNTIWNGTLMEGDNLVLCPDIKEVLFELDRCGILHSIASKNPFDLAWQKLIAFGLDEYFLYPQIGWGNKSDAIKVITDELGIGLNTVVFIDDQAFERDEVRYLLPEVTTMDATEVRRLREIPEVLGRFATNESMNRRRMYQARSQRKEAEEAFQGAPSEFLETLGMCLTIRRATELDLRRAEELTLRTNQLNTTGRVYSVEELGQILTSSNQILLVADLDDRYGPSGIVGLVLIERNSNLWQLKLLITSCRVMSYGIGGILISLVLQSAKRQGRRICADFVRTDRNRMMYVTYRFHGFYEVSTEGSFLQLEHNLYEIRPIPSHVTLRVEDELCWN